MAHMKIGGYFSKKCKPPIFFSLLNIVYHAREQNGICHFFYYFK